MRSLVVGLALLLASTAAHGAGNADVVGTWNLEFDEKGTTVRPTLTLQDSAGKLTGEWSGPRGKTALINPKYESGVLTFDLTDRVAFVEVTVNFTANVAGDKIAGTMKTPRGTVPVTGVRAAPSS